MQTPRRSPEFPRFSATTSSTRKHSHGSNLPWGRSFLHPALREKLQSRIEDPPTQFLVRLAAAKLALVEHNNDGARRELDAALVVWKRMPDESKHMRLSRYYARLLVMRAREAEGRTLLAEALTQYEQALTYLQQSGADEFELHASAYRRALLATCITQGPQLCTDLLAMESEAGDELVNPTWDRATLAAALRKHVYSYDIASASHDTTRTAIQEPMSPPFCFRS